MADKRPSVRFVVIFGFVWIAFGIVGLIYSPERMLVAISQFLAGGFHFGYAIWVKIAS